MSPEAHCASAAALLEREGAKPWHVAAVLHACRSTADHRWHVVNALRSARWWAPSAAAADAIGGLIVALEAMGSLEFGAPADDLDRLALACDTSTDDGYRRYVRLAVAADARPWITGDRFCRADVACSLRGMINLWLDDVRDPPSDGREWTVCRTFEEAKAALMTGSVAFASLDHDLGLIETSPGVWSEQTAPTGYDLVKWMAEHKVWPASKPVVHSANPVGAGAMRQAIDRYWRPNPRTFLVRYADGTEERVSAAQVATGRGGR